MDLKGGRYTHAVWADNIILFAQSFGMMQRMVDIMDEEFGKFVTDAGKRYYNWKPDSFECLPSGPLR